MEETGKINLRAEREALVPKISCLEMSRRIGISHAFMDRLERGVDKWPAPRLAKFREVMAAWRVAPDPRPRKVRKDLGKRHRGYKRGRRRAVQSVAVPVPHSHGEVVGIG